MNEVNRSLVLECVRELSDRQIQENVWTGRVVSQQSSFVEAVEGLFADSGLGEALRNGSTGFSEELESKLCELKKQISLVNTKRGPAGTINDPAMPQLRDLARSILGLVEKEMKAPPESGQR